VKTIYEEIPINLLESAGFSIRWNELNLDQQRLFQWFLNSIDSHRKVIFELEMEKEALEEALEDIQYETGDKIADLEKELRKCRTREL
jgi:hypothetical protein